MVGNVDGKEEDTRFRHTSLVQDCGRQETGSSRFQSTSSEIVFNPNPNPNPPKAAEVELWPVAAKFRYAPSLYPTWKRSKVDSAEV